MHDLIRSELQVSASLVLAGEAVTPRFRVIAPEGQTVVVVPLPDDARERVRRMSLVRGYLAWKLAATVVVSAETQTPDAVMALGVTRTDCAGLLRPIIRKPLSLGPERWLEAREINEEFLELLPRDSQFLDAETFAELQRAFGSGGEFEVLSVH